MGAPSVADSRRAATAEETAPLPSSQGDESSNDLQHLDRLAALGELLAEVVHEVRNGLVSIKTFVQLLPESGGDEAFADQFRRVTEEEFSRIERLLNSVLAQATPRRDQDRTHFACNTRDVVETTTSLLQLRADKVGVSLQVDCPVDSELPHRLG